MIDPCAVNLDRFERFCAATKRDPNGYVARTLGRKIEPERAHAVTMFSPPEGTAFVVKSVSRPEDPTAFAERLKTHQIAFENGVCVPRIYWVFKDTRSVVMSFVPGNTVASVLRSSKLVSAVAAAGTWLADFHRRSGLRRREFQPSFMQRHLSRLADEHRHRTRNIPSPRRFHRALSALDQHAKPAEGASTHSSMNHGDFNPKNVVVGPKGAAGIDFGRFRTAPVAYDVARFLIHSQTLMPRAEWSVETVVDPSLFSAFSDGYPSLNANDPVIQYLLRVRLLIDWASLSDSPMSLNKFRRFRRLQMGAVAVLQ